MLEVDVAVDVPDVEVGANTRGRAAKSHFDAANVVAGIEFQVSNFRRIDSTHKVVVFLL